MNWIRFDKPDSFRKRLICAETGAQFILDPETRKILYVEPGPLSSEPNDTAAMIQLQSREEAERRFEEIERRLFRPAYINVEGNVGIHER